MDETRCSACRWEARSNKNDKDVIASEHAFGIGREVESGKRAVAINRERDRVRMDSQDIVRAVMPSEAGQNVSVLSENEWERVNKLFGAIWDNSPGAIELWRQEEDDLVMATALGIWLDLDLIPDPNIRRMATEKGHVRVLSLLTLYDW